jgi:hypothetical protein
VVVITVMQFVGRETETEGMGSCGAASFAMDGARGVLPCPAHRLVDIATDFDTYTGSRSSRALAQMPTTEPVEPRSAGKDPAAHSDARPLLTAYVEPGCPSCGGTLDVIDRVRRELPGVDVEVVDVSIDAKDRHEGVFAVPTLVLDGRIISLGTPTWSGLAPQLRAALEE